MAHYKNMYTDPGTRARNLVRFKQILTDLTDIYNRFEAGELKAVWFIRRLTAAVLGVTWMTENGKRYCIGWKDGKLIKTLDELPRLELRAAHAHLCQQHLIGCDPIDKLPSNVIARELEHPKKDEDGIALT